MVPHRRHLISIALAMAPCPALNRSARQRPHRMLDKGTLAPSENQAPLPALAKASRVRCYLLGASDGSVRQHRPVAVSVSALRPPGNQGGSLMEMTWPVFWVVLGIILDAIAFLILAHDLVELTRKLPGWEIADRRFVATMQEHFDWQEAERNNLDELMETFRADKTVDTRQGTDVELAELRTEVDFAVKRLALLSMTSFAYQSALNEMLGTREDASFSRAKLTLWRAYLAGGLFVVGAALQIVGLLLTT